MLLKHGGFHSAVGVLDSECDGSNCMSSSRLDDVE